MRPHYYLMKNKKILRLEQDEEFSKLSDEIKKQLLDPLNNESLNQNQANWRVAIFRDEILDLNEYQHWLSSPCALIDEKEYDISL